MFIFNPFFRQEDQDSEIDFEECIWNLNPDVPAPKTVLLTTTVLRQEPESNHLPETSIKTASGQ